MLTFPSAPNHVQHLPQGLSEPRRSTSSSDAKIQPTVFSQISAHTSGHDVIHIPRSYFSIRGFYFDISEWHSRSSQTKPKGKIYKTKSLGHYITLLQVRVDLGVMAMKRYSILSMVNKEALWDMKNSFLWKRCNCRQSFLLPTPRQNVSYSLNDLYVCVCVCVCVEALVMQWLLS